MTFPFGIQVIVHRATAPSRRGDPPAVTTHTIDGCAIAPRYSSEALDGRDTVVVGRDLFAPTGADIIATDVIEDPGGQRWQVDGEPGPWTNPFTGWTPGVQVALKAVAG